MTDLNGRRVIVTGGATGIGGAIGERFLKGGAKVSVWCRNKKNGDAIAAALPGLSGVELVDVAEGEAVDMAFAPSLKKLGGLDVLICNAGISIRQDFLETSREDFERVMRVNLFGSFYASQL